MPTPVLVKKTLATVAANPEFDGSPIPRRIRLKPLQ